VIWEPLIQDPRADILRAGHKASGIISTAIANAKQIDPSGQENTGSLLQHHFNVGKATPMASQFTFTCKSQVMGKALWPGMLFR